MINSANTRYLSIFKGTGSPESVVTAPVGSIFQRTDGGAGTSVYIKDTGTGNTGWIALSSTTIVNGTYTPTLTNVTNVAASTAYQCQYMRVGNVVTVSGKVDIDTTLAAGTASEIGISLPVASNFSAEQNCGGTASSNAVASLVSAIKADATNDRASVVFSAISLSNDSYFFSFTYLVQ